MTREEIIKSMSLQDAIQVLKDTNTYGTADIAKSVILKALEQEPMVEIDLYSVIRQKYIEREVLDKIKAEIEKQEKWLLQAGYNSYNVDIAFSSIKSVLTESEDKNGNNNL